MQAPLALLRITFASLAACLIVAGSAPRAGALSITPDPVVFNIDIGGGTQFLKGNVDFVGMVTGTPSGGIVLDGSVGATDVTFIFTTSLDSDSDGEMGSTTIFRFPASASSPVFTGVGTIPGAGVDNIDAFVGSSSTTVLHDNSLQPGQTSDAYFVSFSSISVGDQLGLEFVILPLGTVTVVPEPQMAVLLLLGLAGLGWRARGRLRV